jgi:hypothetical protein
MNRDELIEVVYRGAPTLHEYDYNQGDYSRAIIKHTLSAIEAAGFAIVPVVASDAMRAAGADNLFGAANDDWGQDAAVIYTAMIEAAKEELK